MKPNLQNFTDREIGYLSNIKAKSFARHNGVHSDDWMRVSQEAISNPENTDLFLMFSARCCDALVTIYFNGEQYVSKPRVYLDSLDRLSLTKAGIRWVKDGDTNLMGFNGFMSTGPAYVNTSALHPKYRPKI